MPTKEGLKAMATWVAAIADNVKNPIAAIGAVLDRAESHLGDPQIVRASIEQARQRLVDLNEYVSELAEFARPAAIQQSLTDVKTLVANAVRGAALPESCTVDIEIASGLRLFVDKKKTEIVVKALLRNGLEAVDAAQAPFLRIEAKATPGGGVSLAVEDNGRGLPEQDAALAFEPFFTTKEAGTGLGLAVARKYVEAHGGTISIDRSPKLGGCRVQLAFPRT